MKNGKYSIRVSFFVLALILILGINAQQSGYDYDSENFGIGSNGGRIVSSPSVISHNNNYQNSGQLNQRRPSNQLSGGLNTGTNGYQPTNGNYMSSRPSQPINEDYSSNLYSSGYQSNGVQLERPSSNQVQSGSSYSKPNNVMSNPTNYNTQNAGYHGIGIGTSGQSIQMGSRPLNSADNSNYGNSEQFNQKQRPTHQSQLASSSGSNFNGHSNGFGDSTLNSPVFQSTERNSVYNNNNDFNAVGNFQSTIRDHQRPSIQQSSSGETYQRKTTRSPQIPERDTILNNGQNSNHNYDEQVNDQWNTKPTENKRGGSTLGIIAANDGFVQARPSPDLDQSTNAFSNSDTNSHSYESNSQTNRLNVGHSNQNNLQKNRNQLYNSDSFEDSQESIPVQTINRLNNNNKNKLNGSNSNGNKKKNNNSGENEQNPKNNNNNRRSQTSAGHQGNKTTKKPNVITLINKNKNKNTESSRSNKKTTITNGGSAKKRVSQIKYEQYLTSIFPDLDNEDVEEVKDFNGRKLARPGQFPHMGAIGFKNHVLNKTEYKCGASLISDIWAITTAHCTEYNGLTPTYVRFGDLNLKAAEEDVDPQTRRISMIVNHPDYTDDSLYNDIALLQLNKVVIFTEFVQPIRIWYRDEIPFTMAYAMGFGAVEFAGKQTNRLTELDLTIVPNDVCARQMPKQPNAKRGIISSQICAIDNKQTGGDTFQGDSGGPLEISFYAEEGRRQRQYLIGMTSFGVVATARLPGVYTRVSSYVDWIEKTVWSSEFNSHEF